MAVVSVQLVLEWLNYWGLPVDLSFPQWDREFDHVPPPSSEPSSYLDLAVWISGNYDGDPIDPPPGD